MEYLQYEEDNNFSQMVHDVLNLVINGIPSIHKKHRNNLLIILCFKPCYKWNTFNTLLGLRLLTEDEVKF